LYLTRTDVGPSGVTRLIIVLDKDKSFYKYF